ncbi:MAG: sulfurtransferase-like selenium metabolism protein YedF [Thermodesulfobacteriota bacterium]
MKDLDCRGLACPQPVLRVKEALSQGRDEVIRVIVDNQAAVGNVTRFAQSQGCRVETAAQGADHLLTLTRVGPAGAEPEITCPVPEKDIPRLVLRIDSEFMGRGPEDLGRVLMTAFLKTLGQASLKPRTIVFYNSGVKLACQGSPHLETLKSLEAAGIKILACGTCLDFFGLKSDLAVGAVTNMFEMIETLSGADRVVSP